MPIQKTDALEYLASSNFPAFIGEFESEWLECKREPYRLDEDRQKLELAKDVSALANAAGGLLLIGFSTSKDDSHGQDRISAVHQFDPSLFNADQYSNVLRDWIYPRLNGIPVTFFKDSSGKGVAAIDVPKLSGSDRPALIIKSILADNDRKIEFLFGLSERKQAGVTHYDAPRIQALIRDGLRFDDIIREGFQSLQLTMEQGRKTDSTPISSTSEKPHINPEILQEAPKGTAFFKIDLVEVDERIERTVLAAGLQALPTMTLAIWPNSSAKIRGLFSSRNSPEVRALENPPELRHAGFDIRFDSHSKIITGKSRRIVLENFGALEAHADGLMTLAIRGDAERLCWGARTANLHINQIALVETTYLFTRLAENIYQNNVSSGSLVTTRLGLDRMKSGENFSFLSSGPIGDWRTLGNQAPSSSERFYATTAYGENFSGRAAWEILTELYHWFGYEDDAVPYTSKTSNEQVVDPVAIQKLS